MKRRGRIENLWRYVDHTHIGRSGVQVRPNRVRKYGNDLNPIPHARATVGDRTERAADADGILTQQARGHMFRGRIKSCAASVPAQAIMAMRPALCRADRKVHLS